jgi:hypothetical protein
MDLTAIFSNDQLAVMGCFAALAVSGVIAALSFQFGSAGRHSQSEQPGHLQLARTKPDAEQQETRRAA